MHTPTGSSGSVPAGLAVLPLLQALREIAAEADLDQLVDLDHPERQSLELQSTDDLQVWLLTWPPGHRTGWHDHGGSSGAYTILRGALSEYTWELGEPAAWHLGRGEARGYVGRHIHDVVNESAEPALTVHAYAPRLVAMTRFERRSGRLVPTGIEQAGVQAVSITLIPETGLETGAETAAESRRPTVAPRFEEVWFDGVDDMLAEARSRLQRLSPRAAFQAALWRTAVLVDVRPEAQRLLQGDLDERLDPLVIERVDLEWLLDPRSAARLPQASYDLPVVVLDAEGTTSSLAAESLQRLGLHAATDVVGGFAAWRAAGMPTGR